jgi:hypothetical protein
MTDFLMSRRQWDAHEMISGCTPKFFHPNKTLLYEMAFSNGKQSDGSIGYSRWAPRALGEKFLARKAPLSVSRKSGFFDYLPSGQAGLAEWHLNFANYDVYSTWAASLFAQDEMQVAEHPGLMALRMAATNEGLSMLCVEDGEPTPIIVTGVERRLSIDTSPNAERPHGLYGNQFKRAWPEQIKAATTVFDDPLKSNLIAIEAPAYGTGSYSEDEIIFIMRTAHAGFTAARDESLATLGTTEFCIHTGYWGCGAYGGNRVLMILLQMIAADMAGVSQIVFHVGDKTGDAPFDEALEMYRLFRTDPAMTTDGMIKALADRHYSWGESDGN